MLLLQKFAAENFPSHTYLDYARAVEKYTLTKGANLVLNVDGCIGMRLCDPFYVHMLCVYCARVREFIRSHACMKHTYTRTR